MDRTRCLVIIGLILVMASMSVPVTAQGNSGEEPPHRHLITTNPFLVLFSWWNIEYEYKIANHSTIGFAGSYYTFEDDEEDIDGADSKYMSAYAIYRYYPSGKAHSGFYFGSRLGMTRVEYDYYDDTPTEDGTVYGFGLDVGYTWLLGDTQHFAMSVGVGATRLFGEDLDEDETGFLPIIRLVNVGVAF
jgi:hypothetical protein